MQPECQLEITVVKRKAWKTRRARWRTLDVIGDWWSLLIVR